MNISFEEKTVNFPDGHFVCNILIYLGIRILKESSYKSLIMAIKLLASEHSSLLIYRIITHCCIVDNETQLLQVDHWLVMGDHLIARKEQTSSFLIILLLSKTGIGVWVIGRLVSYLEEEITDDNSNLN